jgi:putative transposase
MKTEIIYINNKEDIRYLKNFMSISASVYNQTLYFLRQHIFSFTKNSIDILDVPKISSKLLENQLKSTETYSNCILDYNIKQASRDMAISAITGFYGSLKSYRLDKSKFKGLPKLPRYKKSFELMPLIINHTRLVKRGCKENEIKLPKSHFKFKTRIPKHLIRCVRIVNVHHKVKIEVIYDNNKDIKFNLDKSIIAGLDIGVNNLASLTFNKIHKSYLINGRPLKSINQFFNKERSKIQSELKITNDREWSNRLAKLQLKRNNKINDYMHKASKLVVDLLLENNVGKIVIGKNKDWKTSSKMSKKNNQNFISIPHAKFIDMIKYKCDNVGIEVILTEESYTSKVDHLSNEKLCKHKKYSGKRVNRGLFKSFSGKLLNADINGSIGILRKINAISDIDLINLGYRGDVVSPIKLTCK